MHLLAAVALAGFKSRAALQLENLALRHQLGILHRSVGEEAKTDLVRSTALGLGYVSFGTTGVPHWSSSSRRPSLPGTGKAFGSSSYFPAQNSTFPIRPASLPK